MKKTTLILALSFSLIACTGQKQIPTTETYAFSPTPILNNFSTKNKNTVRIMTASITPQFSNYFFIYRISNAQYKTDPYREFLTAPNIAITVYLENNLSKKLNANLISSDNLSIANYVLQENITELYADYRVKSSPEACMTIQFILYHCDGDNKTPVGTLTLSEKTAIAPNNPTSLMAGYQSDMDKMTPQLSNFINQKIAST